MRILVLSDVHADAEALDLTLRRAGGHWDRLVLLGDLVGYGREPAETVARLRALDPWIAVRGNHERMMDDLLAGREPDATHAIRERLRSHAEALDPSDLAWLRALPDRDALPEDAGKVAPEAVHADPDPERPDGYLLGVPDARRVAAHLARPWLLFGHTHVPGGFVRHGDTWRPLSARRALTQIRVGEADGALLNPGSVAATRDGGPGACFLLLDLDTGRGELHRAEGRT